jgi:hypothetical protein
MTASRSILCPFFVAMSVSCGSPSTTGSTPSQEPDLRGSWVGSPSSWTWADSYTYSPETSSSAGCDGSLEITSQNRSSFGGRYVIDCPGSGRSSGTVFEGRISSNGLISFRLLAEDGWGPGLFPRWTDSDCEVSEDPEAYDGTLADGSIAASRVRILSCPAGRVLVTASFQGVRQ